MIAKPGRTYTSLDDAYDHFNLQLFSSLLPPCLITMQRHKGAYGYFSGERFASTANPQEVTDEIALNPAHFAGRTPAATLSTLVHEMCHLWQHHYGTPSRNGYHNKQWAAKMRSVGLIPTDTGQPGGRETGQSVSHIVEERGPFERACARWMHTQTPVLYHDLAGEGDAPARKKKAASKTKYSCPVCEQNAWAKPDTNLVCGDCDEVMEPEEQGED